MTLRTWKWLLCFLAGFTATTSPSVADQSLAAGTVRLPLADYLQLKDGADDPESRDGDIVLLSRSTDVTLEPVPAKDRRDGGAVAFARVRSEFELRVRGVAKKPVALPFGAEISRADVVRTDSNGPVEAGVHRADSGAVEFYALVSDEASEKVPGTFRQGVPGTFRVVLEGTASVMDPHDPVFRWPAGHAARDALRIDLPAETAWQSEGAPLLEDSLTDAGRGRTLRFAGTGEPFTLRLRAEAAERDALVRSTLVTLADLDEDGLRLQDAVVYRVLRGSVADHRIRVPEGRRLQPRAFTDEGEERVDPSSATLEIERRRRLGPGAGTREIGHVLLPYEPVALDHRADSGSATQRIPIPAPGLDPGPRARYLVLGSTVAADLQPVPVDAWRRVDLDDLPGELRDVVAAVEPSSLWQLRDATSAASLEVRRLPAADTLDALVWLRQTTTLLTVDGSLVHRDVFDAQVAGSYLAVDLPPGSRLWSTSVDDAPVRPLEEAGRVLVPVGFRREARLRIEVVAVASQVVEDGRSEIRFAAPRVDVPVLSHEWKLVLPESARYRLDESALDPVDHLPGYRVADRGDSGLAGQVLLEDEEPVPGATVTLSGQGTHRTRVTDVGGRYSFFGLDPGEYRLTAELEGFISTELKAWVRRGRITTPELILYTGVQETITVTSEAPSLDSGAFNERQARQRRESALAVQRRLSHRTLDSLQGAVVRGVKPLPVEIPTSGKLIQLVGALPPDDVWATVDVRKR